jgi:tetratricopeptide (TPR) repeat protein
MPEALFDFERAIRYRPNFAPHLYDYALASMNAGQWEEAQKSVEAALRADSKMAEAHDLEGRLLSKKGQWAEAVREYREALRLRPDFATAQLDLALALASSGDIPGAREQLRDAAKSRDPQIARLAAEALARLQQQ